MANRTPKYQAGLSHEATVSWLHSYEENGVFLFSDLLKPIREFRKEAGTLVNSPVEAKAFLHHGSITTTELISPSCLFGGMPGSPALSN